MVWNRGENIPTVALCCYYSPRIRAVDAVQHEHHTDVGDRDTGAHAVVYVRSHPVLGWQCECTSCCNSLVSTSETQGSSIVGAFASKVVGTVNTGSLNVALRIANSSALPLFVLLVILVASMIIARIVFSNFLAALKTVFSCRFLRCNFDFETEE